MIQQKHWSVNKKTFSDVKNIKLWFYVTKTEWAKKQTNTEEASLKTKQTQQKQDG